MICTDMIEDVITESEALVRDVRACYRKLACRMGFLVDINEKNDKKFWDMWRSIRDEDKTWLDRFLFDLVLATQEGYYKRTGKYGLANKIRTYQDSRPKCRNPLQKLFPEKAKVHEC